MLKMKKVLFVANHKGFSKFNAPYMHWFKSKGWQVDNASPGIEVGEVDNQFDVDIQRSPFSLKNFKAYKDLKRIIENGNYDLIHVHTPMGAVLGRLAAIKARKRGTKVIYTAHGFHFYKGAPIKNWLIYYTIEKLLSRYTDTLVTINREDFESAQKGKLANGEIYQIDGVGVNLDRFHAISAIERSEIRKRLNVGDDDFVALYVAQFIPRKNHKFIISLIPEILKDVPNFKLVMAGNGDTLEMCKELAWNLGVEAHTIFLGGRSDIPDLCGMADIHVSSSIQEGLAIGNIEAMSAGCPLVISNIRGHKDVCVNQRNGFLFDLSEPAQFVKAVVFLAKDKSLFEEISQNNLEDIKKFSVAREVDAMAEIYSKTVGNL